MKFFKLRPSALAFGSLWAAWLLAFVLGWVYGLALGVLVLAGAALGLVLVLLFASVRNLSGQTPLSLDEALGFGAPSAEEEQKRSLLRALKDLEYERSVGKIGEADYQEFSARYREDAKRIMLRLDERLSGSQELAEKLAQDRLRKAGLSDSADVDQPASAEASETAQTSETAASPEPNSAPAQSAPTAPSCAVCSTENDPDARFCKRCGVVLPEAPRAPEGSALETSEEKTS